MDIADRVFTTLDVVDVYRKSLKMGSVNHSTHVFIGLMLTISMAVEVRRHSHGEDLVGAQWSWA